jgi:hypothetical protein
MTAMTTISPTGGNPSLNIATRTLVRDSTKQAPDTSLSSPSSVSTAPQEPVNPHSQASAFLNSWSDAKQVIGSWGNAAQEISHSRKAMAAEMLKRIKEQIRMLMMLNAGDPKARARQIAILARDLAAAAREYASASGNSGQANGITPDNNSVTASSTTPAPDSSVAASTTSPASEQSAPDITSATPDAFPPTTVDATGVIQYQSISAHQANEQLGARISGYSQPSSASQEDREFAMEVRKLAEQLKALAKQNEVRSHKGSNESTEREMAAIDDAFREIEQSLSSLGTPDAASSPSINVVAA